MFGQVSVSHFKSLVSATARACCAAVYATIPAVLLGCGGSDPKDLPSELRELAENVYVERDVLYLDDSTPWSRERLELVAERAQSYGKVCLRHRFEGDGLATLRAMPNLHSLAISAVTGSTEKGLVHLSKLGELRRLQFFNSRVTYAGLLQLADLKKLEVVSITGSPTWLFADQLEAKYLVIRWFSLPGIL